jgi:hypothetical protein
MLNIESNVENWRQETKKITNFARFFRIDIEWTINL